MLSASSPVVYPPSSSPAPKRPHHDPKPAPSRAKTGFLMDDDSDSDQDNEASEPAPKRRMLSPVEEPVDETTKPSPPPPRPNIAGPEPTVTVTAEQPQEPTAPSEETNTTTLPILPALPDTDAIFARLSTRQSKNTFKITTCAGKTIDIKQRPKVDNVSYERLVAARSKTKKNRAERSYYGIEIHQMIDAARKELAKQSVSDKTSPEAPVPSIEQQQATKKPKKTLLWTEKYRARNFVDLVGDDLTNRQVLRWLKRWDPLVFPRAAKPKSIKRPGAKAQEEEEKPHRKILMLTGPPGLGKTTLAHVCAKQAGYEVMEINASDDRSKNVVNTRIRTSLGTENVKTVQHKKLQPGEQQKTARPVCVVVDEVDGVVSGAGASGDGGFIKALMDLISTGEKNASNQGSSGQQMGKKKRKTDDFKQMRPLILICNDVYHPSLRPLRQSSLAEVIHVGKPSVDAVVTRLKNVFDKEGIPCEKDAARKLCEAAWGMTSGLDAKKGAESTAEGDLRGVMVVGEWVAGRVRAASLKGPLCLTRHWVEKNVVRDLAHGGGGARGVGRGNNKDIVSRIFQEGAGFPKGNILLAAPTTKNRDEQPQAQLGFSEQQKKYGMERLRQMIETSGEVDRIVADVFAAYPNHEFNDDSFLTKPDQAYEWLHFHDTCNSRLFGSQEWELTPYLSQSVLACHDLFATPIRRHHGNVGGDNADSPETPFSGPRADYVARETEKENRAMLQALHAQLPPTLMRSFRSSGDIAAEFLPYLTRLVSPDVKPVVVGGSTGAGTAAVRKESEKIMVQRAAAVLADVGVELQKGKIETEGATAFSRGAQWVYRMEPDLDILSTYETSAAVIHGTQAPPVRYAVRQVLDQELQKAKKLRENSARQARLRGEDPSAMSGLVFDDNKENSTNKAKKGGAGAPVVLPELGQPKKDFFGRIIMEKPRKQKKKPLGETDGGNGNATTGDGEDDDGDGDDEGLDEAPLGAAETKVWVTFHEGFSNAVRKPITLDELMRGL